VHTFHDTVKPVARALISSQSTFTQLQEQKQQVKVKSDWHQQILES